jgi:hypothetical protein
MSHDWVGQRLDTSSTVPCFGLVLAPHARFLDFGFLVTANASWLHNPHVGLQFDCTSMVIVGTR